MGPADTRDNLLSSFHLLNSSTTGGPIRPSDPGRHLVCPVWFRKMTRWWQGSALVFAHILWFSARMTTIVVNQAPAMKHFRNLISWSLPAVQEAGLTPFYMQGQSWLRSYRLSSPKLNGRTIFSALPDWLLQRSCPTSCCLCSLLDRRLPTGRNFFRCVHITKCCSWHTANAQHSYTGAYVDWLHVCDHSKRLCRVEHHAPPSWWGRDCGLCPAASVSSPHLWLETSTLAGLSFPREVMMLAASPPSMAGTTFSWLALHTCLNQHLRNTGAGLFCFVFNLL